MMQFATVQGGEQRDSEPEPSTEPCWPIAVAVVGCGIRRGANEAGCFVAKTAPEKRFGESVAVLAKPAARVPAKRGVGVSLPVVPATQVSDLGNHTHIMRAEVGCWV